MKNSTIFFSLFPLSVLGYSQGKSVNSQLPNILIIFADDLGYGDVQAYNPDRGKIPTPNIDLLASQGMRFTDAHSSSAVSSPSRYTLLTGRYHWRSRLQSGIVGPWGASLIAPDRMTLGTLARQQGYRTAAIGKWHLGWDWPIPTDKAELLKGVEKKDVPASEAQQAFWNELFSQPIPGGPANRGFDSYFGTDVPNWPPYCFFENQRTVGIPSEFLPSPLFSQPLASIQGPALKGWELEPILPTLGDRAVRFITESAGRSEPFFLYLPLTAPHTPIAVNEEWKEKSGISAYADFVMETDAIIGRVLEALEKSGMAKNTLVVFTSDNGCAPPANIPDLEAKGHFPSGPLRGRKFDCWEGGHRIPFIVRWPGRVKPGTVCRQLVQQSDLMRTFADIFGVKLPDNVGEDSFSILPLLAGNDQPVRLNGVSCSSSGVPAVREGPWKLILGNPGHNNGEQTRQIHLYNLDDDLGETKNIADAQPERVAKMKALLEKLIADGRSTPGPKQQNDIEVVRHPIGVSYFDTHANIDYQKLKAGFNNVPHEAKMRAWWFWMSGIATKKSITQDLEAMRTNGIAGAILCDNGGNYSPKGVVFMSEEWKDNFAHVIKEAERLGIEISLNIQSGCGDPGNPDIENDNGLKKITWSEKKVTGPGTIEIELDMPPNQIFYKDITVQAIRTPQSELQMDDLMKNWSIKSFNKKESWNAALDRYDLNQFYDEYEGDGKSYALAEHEIIYLNDKYIDGILTWDVPEGEWTIIRYGYTSTGKRNDYASEGYKGGLSFDQIHKKGINAQWTDVVKPLIDIAKSNGNSLKFVHVDSWEMGTTNWTHDFEIEFKKRRGYNIEPYLSVLAGRIVGSREISNRFLEDFRLTVGDMVADYNYGEMLRLAHAEGISMHSESAGPHLPPVDGLKTLGINDIPMGESWARSQTHRNTEGRRKHVKMGASAAHIYGKRFFAAEIPTSVGPVWERSPADVKIVLDRAFCTGVNRINWHTYTSSPDEYGLPGIEYFAGTHLNRHVTWWKESKTFIDYINRSQHMLIQGLHVADVLGYLGSGVPLFGFLDSDRGDIPPGYAWDMCNSDVLLNRASVKNGRIYLPDGKNYALLALSDHKDISLPVLQKIEIMVEQGMVLVGTPPERSSGLTNYPKSDKELKAIVKKLWGDADGVNTFVNKFGKGTVYVGKTVAQVLEMEKIKPDLAWKPETEIDLEYIHHTSADVDVYYVLNKWAWKGINDLEYRNVAALPDRYVETNCTFRVEGDRKIERWDPVTGEITQIQIFEQKDGFYTLPVSFEPEGAAFYVFSKAEKTNHINRIEKDGKEVTAGNTPLVVGASGVFVKDWQLEVFDQGRYKLTLAEGEEINVNSPLAIHEIDIQGPWQVTFQEKPLSGETFQSTFRKLISLTESELHNIRYFSGTVLYEKNFTIEENSSSTGRAYLNLGKVGDIATINLNGKELGTLWKPPYIADITDYLKKGENKLEVSVTNLWINRLLGDEKLPAEKRKTSTNLVSTVGYNKLKAVDADKYLRVSGLMGPVKVQFSRIYDIIN